MSTTPSWKMLFYIMQWQTNFSVAINDLDVWISCQNIFQIFQQKVFVCMSIILKFYTLHYFISSQVDKAKNGKKRAPPAISVLGPTSPGPCPCQRPGDICCFFLAWHISYRALRRVLTSKICCVIVPIFEVGICT